MPPIRPIDGPLFGIAPIDSIIGDEILLIVLDAVFEIVLGNPTNVFAIGADMFFIAFAPVFAIFVAAFEIVFTVFVAAFEIVFAVFATNDDIDLGILNPALFTLAPFIPISVESI